MKKLLSIVLAILWVGQAYGQQTIDPRLLPAGVPRQIQIDGTNVSGVDPINIQQSAEIDPGDQGGGVVQWVLRNNSIADARIISITTRAKLPSALAYEDEANSWNLSQTFTGAVSVGTTGSFTIAGSSTGTITFTRAAAAGTYNFYLPTSAGTAGQALLSGGGNSPMTYGTLGLAAGGTNKSTAWTASRCVRVNDAGTALEMAAADCGTGTGGGGHVIYDGSGLFSQRTKLRFLGTPITIADNAGNDSTDVTISGVPSLSATYAWTGPHSWTDNNFSIKDNLAPTSIMTFQLSGISGTRVYTPPDANTNLLGGSDIGTTVQAYNAKLAAISGLTWAADQITYATGASAASQFTATSFSRGLMAGVDAPAWRTALALAIGTNVQAYNARLGELAALTPTANRMLGSTASNFVFFTVPSGACDPIRYDPATLTFSCASYPGGTITAGTIGTYAKYNTTTTTLSNGTCLAEDADSLNSTCTFEAGTGFKVGFVRGAGISADRVYTLARNVDGDVALTTGTLNDNNLSKYDASGHLISSGLDADVAKIKSITFRIGGDGGAVLANQDEIDVWENNIAAMTITEVKCRTNTGTARINLQRNDGSPANILAADLDCTTGGATTSSFSGSENILAVGNMIDFRAVNMVQAGSPTRVTISIKAVLN